MRRSVLIVATLLSISGLASGCAHNPSESVSVAKLDTASQSVDEPSVDVLEPSSAGAEGPSVISFDDVDDGPVDMVAAPPKRKQIPSFELFGTGETTTDEGPKLTLPPGIE